MTQAKKGASTQQTSHGTDRDRHNGNEAISTTTACTPPSAAESIGTQQTNHGVKGDKLNRSKPAGAATCALSPIANNDTNEGAVDNRSIGRNKVDTQIVQPTSTTLDPVGTDVGLNRPVQQGCHFIK